VVPISSCSERFNPEESTLLANLCFMIYGSHNVKMDHVQNLSPQNFVIEYRRTCLLI
jgi:hypothetical protein